MTSTTAAAADTANPSAALLERVMRPYAGKGCIYLERASVDVHDCLAVGSGQFSIAESCYIDDTGHFNAVEFNISYNQLFYYTLAACIQDNVLPQFSGWTLEDYWPRQLPNILIHRMSTNYSRPIDPRSYRAGMTITDIGFRHRSRAVVTVETHIEFSDDKGGRATGDVSVAIIDPPAGHQA